MSRHRAAPARAATPPPTDPTLHAAEPHPSGPLPRSGRRAEPHPSGPLPRARRRAEPHPSGPLPRARRRGPDEPDTAALDLAAIALAAAGARQAGLPATGTSPATGATAVPRTTADDPAGRTAGPVTGGTPRPAYPAAVPSALAPVTPSHPLPAVARDPGRRTALPTRTAGALALVGALAGGGVAVIGGSAVLAADPTPASVDLAPEVASAAANAAVPADEPAEPAEPPADAVLDLGGY
ncbi:hypothetical protein [Actinomycetospora straminea]|uniref:Meckel syndrome type 1 protein n=1 Tax=Actinomycetospora straminea TaxID=663607 RepID=A0ABP9E737_9PSEU|nr:hypothetical protein [Actinomycetospora straminea]MDD7936028.1 hypothetical protein [Actinomycetospora straminea]